MGILGALWERFHPINPVKAQKTAEASFSFYCQLEKDRPDLFDGLRVFLSCLLALKAIKADGDQVVSNHKLAAVATFPEQGVVKNIIEAGTVIARCRGHMRDKEDLVPMAITLRDETMPDIRRKFNTCGLESDLYAVYLASQNEISSIINTWNKQR